MSEPPRRRRSTPPTQPPPSSSMLPTIALGIGVVVAGLGIGAFLSAVQHKDQTSTTSTTKTAARGVPAVTPVARPSRGAVALATMVAHPTPTATPRPTPTPAATETPTAAPTATEAATATPRATATPHATATPRAAPTPTAAVVTPRPATPAPVVVTPRPATPRPTVAPTVIARATPALGFSGVAQNTVRRYLTSLIAGNENAAYAELGKAPGEPGASLSEEAFIDRGTRITSMRTTATDANGATVEVELTSARGSYYATYHVTNGPNGPVIDQHDYIKV
jgi:hypothetical protein